MVFDPSKIKDRKIAPEELPEDAPQVDKISALAQTLLDRGLASTTAAAKSLAEGMVDTEKKVISESHGRESHDSARAEFQRADQPLFRAVGGVPRLGLSPEFHEFIARAAPLQETKQRMTVRESPPPVLREPPKQDVSKEKIVMYDDAPDHLQVPEEEWKLPEKAEDPGYKKTMVESSTEGVVVRDVEATANTDTVVERGVILEDESLEEEAAPEERDLAKEEGIDLFDIFKS